MTFISNVKAAFDNSADEKDRDSGELVSTIITTAGFAVMGLLAVNWLSTAVLNKAADVGTCIEGANSYTATNAAAREAANATNCANKSGGLSSFKTDAGYVGRK
jgi:hypothetical protein